jgi:adenylate cyclase
LRYLFDDCALDIDCRELRRGGDQVALEPQVFDLLVFLVRNRQRVVGRDELITSVWHGRIVSESALNTRIHAARCAIGDSGDEQRLIKTSRGRGIRFVGPVKEEAPQPEQQKETRNLSDQPSIAVLAFTNLSGDPGEDYFSEGITEDILTELSRFSELLVISSNSSFQYKGKSIDLRLVGRELGVRYVLQGSIRKTGIHIRVNAHLINAVTGALCWAERYDRKLEEIFVLQDDVARTIVAMIAAHVNKVETERALAKPPTSWQAYDYYMRAAEKFRCFLSSLSKDDLQGGRQLLRQALAIDPGYARAHAAFSVTYVSLWVHWWDDDCPWASALDHASQSAYEAVRLAPNLPDAHVALGWALIWRRQHEAAIAAFERAFALNPNLTNFRFAFALVLAGDPSRALALLETHMRLDPFYDPHAPAIMGFAYYMLKRYVEALPHLHECVSRAPNMRTGRVWLAATYAQLGQLDSARLEAMQVLRIDPSFTINRANIFITLRRPEDAKHFHTGLQAAGLPIGNEPPCADLGTI